MSLLAGDRLGPYEIVGLLGVGGMGEVYRAHDTNLGRQVAIKVLPDAVSQSAERLVRFDREARTLAVLNHPNIAQVHGLEKSTGMPALVMELVEGPTLADRIAQAALPIDEALSIARQIADALEAAHEQGIVHRDLKPANVKVRPDGTVKVLDFGLAKAFDPVGTNAEVSALPTITSPAMTALGTILGTAAYMSPEQARGKAVDKRTDIWAFGCVLYEMLTGRLPFPGEEVSDTLAAILKQEPDWSRLPPATPAAVRRLLDRCLQKDPRQRLRDIGDARPELVADAIGASPSRPRATWREAAAWIAAGVIGIAWLVSTGIGPQPGERAATVPIIVAPIAPPAGRTFQTAGGRYAMSTISPDGTTIVFGDGERLWLKRTDQLAAAEPLPGTDGAVFPFWSPDSAFVAFRARGRLMRIHVGSKQVSALSDMYAAASGGGSGTWNREGDILWWTNDRFYHVRETDGRTTPMDLIDPARPDEIPKHPSFLPDGRHYLFFLPSRDPVRQGVYVASLDSPERALVIHTRAQAAYAAGRLLYVRPGSAALVAQRFDLDTFTVSGDPQRVVDQVALGNLDINFAAFSLSQTDMLVYHETEWLPTMLAWYDRNGLSLGTLGAPGHYVQPEFSPDGSQLLVTQYDPPSANAHVLLFDLHSGVSQRLTTGSGSDFSAVWSADGSHVAFAKWFDGVAAVYRKNMRTTVVDRLFEPPVLGFPTDWSADGRMAYNGVSGAYDVYLRSLGTNDDELRPVVAGPDVQGGGRFSPDGRWLSYSQVDSEGATTYVKIADRPGQGQRASPGRGAAPRWTPRPNGRELVFQNDDGLWSVDIRETPDGRLTASQPKNLLQLRESRIGLVFAGGRFALHPDGRILAIVEDDAAPPLEATLFVNWPAKLDAGASAR